MLLAGADSLLLILPMTIVLKVMHVTVFVPTPSMRAMIYDI